MLYRERFGICTVVTIWIINICADLRTISVYDRSRSWPMRKDIQYATSLSLVKILIGNKSESALKTVWFLEVYKSKVVPWSIYFSTINTSPLRTRLIFSQSSKCTIRSSPRGKYGLAVVGPNSLFVCCHCCGTYVPYRAISDSVITNRQ